MSQSQELSHDILISDTSKGKRISVLTELWLSTHCAMILVCLQHSSHFHCGRRTERKRGKQRKGTRKSREGRDRSREKEGVWFTGGVLLCRYPKAGFNKTSIWLSCRAISSQTSQQPSSPPQPILGGLREFAWPSLLPQQDRALY